MRRILFVLIIILLIAAGGFVWYVRNNQEAVPETQNTNTWAVKKIIDEPVVSPVSAFDNNSIWYFNAEGRLFKANVDGSNVSEFSLSSLSGGTLTSAIWPHQGSDFIALIRETTELGETMVTKNYYDSNAKLFIGLASNIQWLEWLPNGQQVVYVWQSTDKKSQQLVLANPDGSGFRNIASVFWPDLALKADPTGKTILMYRTSIVGETNKIYAANVDTGVISTMVDTGKNTAAKWLPVGNKFLFSKDGKVYLFDVLNKMTTDLNLSTTLDRVVSDASGKTLYAAVTKEDKSGDSFVKVDLSSNRSTKYFDSSAEVRVKNILLVGNVVYYVDSRDNKLYSVTN